MTDNHTCNDFRAMTFTGYGVVNLQHFSSVLYIAHVIPIIDMITMHILDTS